MNRNLIVLGVIGSILMLCQRFVFQSFRKYLIQKIAKELRHTYWLPEIPKRPHRNRVQPDLSGVQDRDKQSSYAYT